MMVLFKFEEALGNFVKNNASIDQISELSASTLKISDALEKSYLDDIFQMAIMATKGTSSESYVKDLYKSAHAYELFQIRNTIAHPNRHFFDCYWFRVAAMGSHPALEKLGIRAVKAAIWSAENGTIEDPPEGWEEKYTWVIPNNLPDYSDYDITGLVGRGKDKEEIKKRLSSPRVHSLAIVAPGGIGKTALAVDVLRDLVSSPESTSWLDGIIFLTLKTEELSTAGISQIDCSEISEDLGIALGLKIGEVLSENVSSLNQAVDEFSHVNLLICIDNLESILRDNPEVFEQLAETLPPKWKLLVTSRVSITNSAIYTLEALGHSSAMQLARTYVRSRGAKDLAENEYKEISEKCFFNPLAIRLTLDYLLTGHKLPDSLKIAKGGIAEYSYKNLIESLSDTSVKILEIVFFRPEIGRNSICEMLEIRADEAAEALLALSNTSLISRSVRDQGNDSWMVNDSVNDLLITNPRNLAIRSEVQSLLKRKSIAIMEIDREQLENRTPKWHEDYIDPSLDNGIKLLLVELTKAVKSFRRDKTLASELYTKFSASEGVYGKNAEFHRGFARLLGLLGIPSKAKHHFEQSILTSPDDIRLKYCYARYLFELGEYPRSEELYKEIIENSAFNSALTSDARHVDTVYQGYFLSLLSSGKYEKVLEETKDWKESGAARRAKGIFRAGSLKRSMEKLVGKDNDRAIELLRRAFVVMGDVLATDSTSSMACRQAFKMILEFKYFVMQRDFVETHNEKIAWIINWIDQNLALIMSNGKISDQEVGQVMTELALCDIPDNPFSERVYWKSLLIPLITKGVDLDKIPSEAKLVHVSAIMKNEKGNRSNFLFAKDELGNDYFVHFRNFVNQDWDEWQNLREHYPLVVYSATAQEDKPSLRAESVDFVNT